MDEDDLYTGPARLKIIVAIALAYLVLIVVAGSALVLLAAKASAHDAPSGWTYPIACCSNVDCREVGDANTPHATIRVFETADGYRISSTGEVIPMTSRKVRPSPDGVFHWCSVQGKDDGKTICLFVPPRGY